MMPADGIDKLRAFDAIFLGVVGDFKVPDLFGDILSDFGPAIAGSIGIAASTNLNAEKQFPSIFEPVHGSAPDIAGKGIANPIGTFWSAQMMLAFLGERKAAQSLMTAIEAVTTKHIFTTDLGGNATTREFTEAVMNELNGNPRL
jgi:tartrate dehydrogenase/decarboxylase / D-malate dehydrogenase